MKRFYFNAGYSHFSIDQKCTISDIGVDINLDNSLNNGLRLLLLIPQGDLLFIENLTPKLGPLVINNQEIFASSRVEVKFGDRIFLGKKTYTRVDKNISFKNIFTLFHSPISVRVLFYLISLLTALNIFFDLDYAFINYFRLVYLSILFFCLSYSLTLLSFFCRIFYSKSSISSLSIHLLNVVFIVFLFNTTNSLVEKGIAYSKSDLIHHCTHNNQKACDLLKARR